MYLLDTNICSAIIKGNHDISAKILTIDNKLLRINWVIASELHYGVIKKGSTKLAEKVNAFLETFEVEMSNPTIISAYAKTRHQLASKGKIIGSNDLWIASHALCQDYILVTHNTKEFERVDGLKTEDWLSV